MFRSLGAVIDTKDQTVHFRAVPCTVPLQLSPRRLFTLDVSELIRQAEVKTETKRETPPTETDFPVLSVEIQGSRNGVEKSDSATDFTETTAQSCSHTMTTPPSGEDKQTSQKELFSSRSDKSRSNKPYKDVCIAENLDRHGQGTFPAILEHGEGPQIPQPEGGAGHHDSGTTARKDHPVWKNQGGTDLRQCGEDRPGLLHMVPGILRGVDKGFSSGVHTIPQTAQEFMEEALNLPSASGTLGTTAKSRAAPKAGYTKDMEKRGRSSSPISSLEDVEDEDWSRVAALENPQIGELHNRVSNMEAALTQIMPAAWTDAADHDSCRTTMNSSTPQGHMIDQVCKGLNAYIHYMGNCSGTHSFDSPGGRNWVLDEMKAYMDKKGHVIGKNRHRSIHAIDILEIYCSEE